MDDDANDRTLIVALVVLALGHMLSTLLRTIPAISLDVMSTDFHTLPQTLASLTAIYHFAFAASQIPVGAALDRFGVRPVSLCLLAGTIGGATLSALAIGPITFMLSQALLGIATSGMLMCPMTLAAKNLPASRFGLWSGVILSIGNMGMLLSSSPLAWVIEHFGWRVGFWLSGALGFVVAALVAALVPRQEKSAAIHASPFAEMASVVRTGLSRPLRGIMALALVSLAAALVLRGLWGGPWLMDIKGLTRVEAGNTLGLFTLALIAGPLLLGILDRRVGHRRGLLAGSHLLSAGLIGLIVAGGSHAMVSRLFGVEVMPPQYDAFLFVLIGICISTQPLLFGMTRQIVDVQNSGKALAAVNLAFFLGTAVLQSATGIVAAAFGLPAVLLFMAGALVLGVAIFLAYTSSAPRSA